MVDLKLIHQKVSHMYNLSETSFIHECEKHLSSIHTLHCTWMKPTNHLSIMTNQPREREALQRQIDDTAMPCPVLMQTPSKVSPGLKLADARRTYFFY